MIKAHQNKNSWLTFSLTCILFNSHSSWGVSSKVLDKAALVGWVGSSNHTMASLFPAPSAISPVPPHTAQALLQHWGATPRPAGFNELEVPVGVRYAVRHRKGLSAGFPGIVSTFRPLSASLENLETNLRKICFKSKSFYYILRCNGILNRVLRSYLSHFLCRQLKTNSHRAFRKVWNKSLFLIKSLLWINPFRKINGS